MTRLAGGNGGSVGHESHRAVRLDVTIAPARGDPSRLGRLRFPEFPEMPRTSDVESVVCDGRRASDALPQLVDRCNIDRLACA